MSKTLNEDFLYYISEEGDYDLMIVCVCTLFFFFVRGHLLRIY